MKTACLLIAGLLALGLPAGAASNWKNLKQGETGTPDRAWKGGNGLFEIQGVLGGATVNLQRKLAPVGDYQNVTPITTRGGAADCDLTVDAEFCWFVAPGDSQIHPVVVGGDGTTDITVMVSGADQASVGGGGGALITTDNAVQFGNAAGDGLDEDPGVFFYDGALNIATVAASTNWLSFTRAAFPSSFSLSTTGILVLDARDTQQGPIFDVKRHSEERLFFEPHLRRIVFRMTGTAGIGTNQFIFNGGIGDAGALRFQGETVNEWEIHYDDATEVATLAVPGNFGTSAIELDSSGDVRFPQGLFTIAELSADPAAPAEGNCVIWMSDGTGSGLDGDLMATCTAGAATNTRVFSAH